MTMLVTTMLAPSLLAATAEARGGSGDVGSFGRAHIGAFGGGRIGGFGGGRVNLGNRMAYGLGLRHYATHRFGGIWPGYGGLFDDGLDCYNPNYRYPPYYRPPYCD
ncbi:hypothetical protein IVB38_37715 [Bradyrhizobium sp. 38]|uniref:hypothetical protein n=1 Tax=unclassified Bradyrhizobium TaxID=2631580 RepID=UPI001FF9D22C|nr:MULTISPECIES: hypothetical protein [unclassified Bradyrhizobium]MCK1341572.1 hypothetical protein [Bradyrhizobium sp. 38]MCK1778897.1 hypothetical protein [Bradyrhizobium sp. 132]